MSPVIREYTSADRADFERCNRWWLEEYFIIEPIDAAIITDPERLILAPGGRIFVAEIDGQVAGVCALRPSASERDVYEFAKMGVLPDCQGKGIGRALTMHVIAEAKRMGARRLDLYSVRMLEAAIALYRNCGFHEVALTETDSRLYERCDIKLQLPLNH